MRSLSSRDAPTPPPAPAPTDALVGRMLNGAYRLEEKLGEGSMGAVYSALQLPVEREVAVKVLRPGGPFATGSQEELISRFEREALATSRLSHPNTVRMIDFGRADGGLLYLVLELLRGHTLRAVVDEEGQLDPFRVARIGRQIAQSLAEAHGEGVIHRDLKPENIFVCWYAGDTSFVKVMDFGVAAMVAGDVSAGHVAESEAVLGTVFYMSPEQASGQTVGASSDLYALGAVLYEALCGRPPFQASSFMEVALKHIREPPPPLVIPSAKPNVLACWTEVIDRLLAKEPSERYRSAYELIEAFDALVAKLAAEESAAAGLAHGMPIGAEPPPSSIDGDSTLLSTAPLGAIAPIAGPPGLPRWRRPLGWLIAVLLVCGGVFAAGFVLGGLPALRESGPPPAAPPVAVDVEARVEARIRSEREATEARITAQILSKLPPARLKIRSKPKQAGVFRDRNWLCNTPCDETLPAALEPEQLILRQEGYRDATVDVFLAPTATVDEHVTLEAWERKKVRGVPKASDDSGSKKKKRKRRGKKRRGKKRRSKKRHEKTRPTIDVDF